MIKFTRMGFYTFAGYKRWTRRNMDTLARVVAWEAIIFASLFLFLYI